MSAGCSRIPPRYGAANRIRVVPWLLGALSALAAGAILFAFNPAQSEFYPFCFFYKTTGLLCPGCGTLRATHQLLHGHVATAFRFNALFVLWLPLAALYGMRLIHRKLKRQPASVNISPRFLWCALAVLVVFGVLRNLPFAQTAWFTPSP